MNCNTCSDTGEVWSVFYRAAPVFDLEKSVDPSLKTGFLARVDCPICKGKEEIKERFLALEAHIVKLETGLRSLKVHKYHVGCKWSAMGIEEHNARIDALLGAEDHD